MKRIFSLILVCMMTFSLAGCSAGESRAAESSAAMESGVGRENGAVSESSAAAENDTVAENGTASETSELPAGSDRQETAGEASADTLIIYFSCTGNTKAAAEEIQKQTGADMFEIVPEIPYTAEDLNYNDDDSRANQEQSDDSARPVISGSIEDFDSYEIVFVGYPIWWGTLPKIVNTLLDTYDFSGKTVIPFCTSGGSGIGTSVSVIREAEPEASVLDGLRVGNNSDIAGWLEEVLP